MEFTSDDFIIGVYHVENEKGSSTCFIKKTLGDNKYTCEMRLREFVDDKVWESKDKKSVVEFEISTNVLIPELIEKCKIATKMCFENFMGKIKFEDYQIVMGDIHKLIKIMQNASWTTMKVEKIKESA